MPKANKVDLIKNLVLSIKSFQDAVDFFDTSVARSLGINDTDLRCLVALNDRGPLTAGEVAKTLGLTKGATTTALNRLEKAKLAKRSMSPNDGRSFLIELTARGRDRMKKTWQPMRQLGGQHLINYSESELNFLIEFFKASTELQKKCAQLL